MTRTFLIIALLTVFLAGCTTPSDNDTPDDTEEPIMNQTDCTTTTIDASSMHTATLDAVFLFQHATLCEGLDLVDGRIVFEEGVTEGRLETDVFTVAPFRELVPSWNIAIDQDAKIRVRVQVGNDAGMSDPFLMAYWTASYKTSLANQEDEFGKVYIDTIVNRADDPLTKIKFIVEFDSGQPDLKSLSFTTVAPESTLPIALDEEQLKPLSIVVPAKQQLSVPAIGNAICSPTSLAMVLAMFGTDQDAATVAGLVYDEGPGIYGNWSFNVSYAGGLNGLSSRVEYIDDLAVVVSYLEQGVPIVLSIRTTDISQLDGTIMAYPAGHLLVLRGLEQVDGTWFALVNDPAEYTDEAVPRSYPLEQLLSVWRGYAYVVTDQSLSDLG